MTERINTKVLDKKLTTGGVYLTSRCCSNMTKPFGNISFLGILFSELYFRSQMLAICILANISPMVASPIDRQSVGNGPLYNITIF